MAARLSKSFYVREEVSLVARELLGKRLLTSIDGVLTGGMVVETEAYSQDERACHAYGGKRTARTEIFYSDGGLAYVYLCYGIHYLFNIITGTAERADAVLIRAIEPTDGIDYMLQRRKMDKLTTKIACGPGSVSQALGINKTHYGANLLADEIWLEDHDLTINDSQVLASSRVGVAYAGEDALLPWRYRIKDNPYTGKMK